MHQMFCAPRNFCTLSNLSQQRQTKKNIYKFSASQTKLLWLKIYSFQIKVLKQIEYHRKKGAFHSHKMYNKESFGKRALEGTISQLLFLDNTF